MAFDIVNWNIAENQTWYVRLADAGSGIAVSLHSSQSDAENNVNSVASTVTAMFGSEVEVIFPSGVSLYLPQVPWHMLVSGQPGDPTRIVQVKPFVDLPEISHPVYANPDMALQKARSEIDLHTHVVIKREVKLGVHLPAVDVGNPVRISSSRAGDDVTGQVTEHLIIGEPSRLVSSLEVTSFMELEK